MTTRTRPSRPGDFPCDYGVVALGDLRRRVRAREPRPLAEGEAPCPRRGVTRPRLRSETSSRSRPLAPGPGPELDRSHGEPGHHHRRPGPGVVRRARRGGPRRRRPSSSAPRRPPPSSGPARWSTSSPRHRPRRTGSRPGSARSPPGTSPPRCAPSCSARWCARTRPAPGPRSSARWSAALMLLRLSTLATGHTGVRPETAQLLAGLLTPRHHAGGARVRLAGLLRRPGPARALRAGADGRGRRCATPRAGWCRPPTPWPRPGWRRSSWPPRRAWR